MSVKVIYLAGVPACGKTTMFKRIRMELFEGVAKEFKHGLCRGIESNNGAFSMLGVFDGSTFEGTDRLSMAVINDAMDYVSKLRDDTAKHVVFVEGDRLFNHRFVSGTGAELIIMDANEEVLNARHRMRGNTQNERFLRSRRSKVENFIKAHGCIRVYNNNDTDAYRIFNYIISAATSFVK